MECGQQENTNVEHPAPSPSRKSGEISFEGKPPEFCLLATDYCFERMNVEHSTSTSNVE